MTVLFTFLLLAHVIHFWMKHPNPDPAALRHPQTPTQLARPAKINEWLYEINNEDAEPKTRHNDIAASGEPQNIIIRKKETKKNKTLYTLPSHFIRCSKRDCCITFTTKQGLLGLSNWRTEVDSRPNCWWFIATLLYLLPARYLFHGFSVCRDWAIWVSQQGNVDFWHPAYKHLTLQVKNNRLTCHPNSACFHVTNSQLIWISCLLD